MTDWAGILSDYRSWLRIERSLSPNTVTSYLSDITKLRELYPDRRPEDITGEDIASFISSEVDKGISKRSQSRLISSVKSFFGFLETEGRLDNNPADTVDSPKLSRHIPTVLSVDEVKRILESVDLSAPEGHRNRAILEVLYSCGLRVSELVSLRISDLFLEESFIRVIGKGDKQRLVPIGEPAIRAVQLYLSQTRRELTETREKAATTDRALAQVQTKAETAEARLEATRQQLSEAERKLRSDVLDRYSEAAVRLDFALTEKRLVIDQDVNATFFIPVVKIAGRTVVPAFFADLTGGTQSPLSYQKITRLDYRLSPTAAGDGAMESKSLTSPLLVPPGEPRVGAFEVDAPGRVPLSLLTIDALKQRGVENLFLFKTSSFGKDSAELGGRCSIDFGTAEPYLYIRNTGRGTGSELRAEPGDFIMSREGDFVGVVVGIESFDLGRRQEAKCYVFPENFSWEDAVSIPVVLQPGQTYFDSFGNDVRRNNEVIDQLTQ